MTHKQQQTWLFNEILCAASWKMLEKHHFSLFFFGFFCNKTGIFSWNVKELQLSFRNLDLLPLSEPVLCCWPRMHQWPSPSVPRANLLKRHTMCLSFVTACTFPVICFWPLMQDKCMQSSLFSRFCFDSKDRVEVRVCLLAAFVCVFVWSRVIHSGSVKAVVMVFPQHIDFAMSRRCLCEITPEMAN